MSTLAPTAAQSRAPSNTADRKTVDEWRPRIQQALEARKPFEPRFLSDLAFAAGQHWLVWDTRQRKMRHIADIDPRYAGRELYTADRITEYREAQLGELSSDDDRPELLTVQSGDEAEQATSELNRVAGYAWEHEWDADEALRIARRYCVDLGVSALRCRWNPTVGPVVGHAPIGPDGHPVDPTGIQALTQTGQLPDGSLPKFKPVREGRTNWEPYTALQILPPPGATHERSFPWEILVRPVAIDDLKTLYGPAANGLTEDTDIATAAGLTTGQTARTGQTPQMGRLRDHVWLYSCFRRPTGDYPDGQVVEIASNQYVLMDATDQLPYTLPNGQPHSGVVYLHWRRRSDRWWSGSFIGNLKDPQRIINRRKTQNLEIIDRGMPKAYTEDGSLIEEPTGAPMENVKMRKGAQPPSFFPGAGPGPWMYSDIETLADDLSHASTLSALRLGENPQNVDTYSQLALLNENETVKRSLILTEHRAAIATLVELSLGDIDRYWPQQKRILVAGDDDRIEEAMFEKTRMPRFFMAKVAKGAPQPRSQAAELKKIDAIWAAAVETGLAVRQPDEWTRWYKESIDAGHPLDLPEPEKESQQRMAALENLLMREGQQPPVMDYDLLPQHLPEHREAMDEARAAGDTATLGRLALHVQDHIRMAQTNALRVAAQQSTPSPFGPAPLPGGAAPAGAAGGSGPPAIFAGSDFEQLAAGNP